MSDGFMAAFCIHPEVPRLFEDLLNDPQAAVRQNTAVLIRQKFGTEGERCGHSAPPPCSPGLSDTSIFVNSLQNAAPTVQRFRDFFWPLIWRLVRPAITGIGNSVEILDLCFDMLQTLQEAQPETLDLEQLSDDWFSLLLDYTTSEVRIETLYMPETLAANPLFRISPGQPKLTLLLLVSLGSCMLSYAEAVTESSRRCFP